MPEPRARRLRERLARSGRLFVAGLIVACGAQVLIEWHTTVREVNGLRGQLRQKGENYVDVLRKASEDAMAEGNGVELDRIAGRLFDDEDVVYVRFQAADGRSVHERLRPSFGERVRRRFRQPFREHYRYVMERDLAQMIGDPVGLRERMEHSRHGDWIQRLTDAEDRLLERLGRAPPESGAKPEILYQDRLAMHHGAADRSLSYALGTIERPDRRGRPLGVVLLAFSDARVERAVASRLVRGAVTTLLFVGLVAAQHLGARRRRLRLLDLEREVAGARDWLAPTETESLPRWADVGAALARGEGAPAIVFDLRAAAGEAIELLVLAPVEPGLPGVLAAALLRHQLRRAPDGDEAPGERLRRALASWERSPEARPLALLLARFRREASALLVEGLAAGLAPPVTIEGDAEAAASTEAIESPHLAAPARPFRMRTERLARVVVDAARPPSADAASPIAVENRASARSLAERLAAGKSGMRRRRADRFALVIRLDERGRG